MFRNCLAAAWGSARRDRFYVTLNVLGLALGLAMALLIWLFVREELSFNSFLPGYQDTYVIQLSVAETGQPPLTWRGTPAELAGQLRLAFPEIEAAARDAKQFKGMRHGDVEATESLDWVDDTYLAVMPFRLLRGDPATALAAPDTIVLTRSLAQKYFGSLEIVGESVDIDRLHPMRVTGVAEDPPDNSTFKFTALASGKTGWGKLAALDAAPTPAGELSLTTATFLRLRPGVRADDLAGRLPAFAREHYPDPGGDGAKTLYQSLCMKSLADVHLHPHDPDTGEQDHQVETLYAVAATGVFIVLLAAVNFVNLSTARAARRATEVAVRKSLGALRGQLMVQFIAESLAYALAGLALALILLPGLNALVDRHIRIDFWREPVLAAVPVGMAVALGVVAGFYPALVLSGFAPASALKSRSGASVGGGRLRLGLVVFQFAVTICLIVATIVIYRQITFATTQALGFDKDLVLTIDLTGMPEEATPDGLGRRDEAPVERLRARLAAVPGVQAIAATFAAPLLTQSFTLDYGRPGRSDPPSVSLTMMPVDFGLFGVYRAPLLAGRDFSRDFVDDKADPRDKTRLSSAVLNTAAVQALGFPNATAALGQEVQSVDPSFPTRTYRVIGVAPDIPLDTVRVPVPPSLFLVDPDLFNVLNLKLSGTDLPGTLRGIDAVWGEFVPERRIGRMFLEDRIAGLYVDVERQGRLFAIFSGFAVAIGCFGLIGLAAYTAERRTKEIGIRKALGASTGDVFLLLVTQFAKPVLLANLLAWPVAWWFMRGWLEGFAYRIDLGPAPFLAAALAAGVIAVATTAFNAIRSARARPVTALRYE